jgi:hypothetical protein
LAKLEVYADIVLVSISNAKLNLLLAHGHYWRRATPPQRFAGDGK